MSPSSVLDSFAERPAAPAGTALRGRSLTLSYGRSTVVRDVSLQLQPGRITVLIGPNGSGKSTALRGLARLHRIDAGDVIVTDAEGERSAASLSAKSFARTVAMLSQSRPHPSGLQVRDVVAFGRHPHRGRFAGLDDTDRRAIAHALDATGLDSMAHRAVDELSGGELQRVWLATALAQDTGILLLDEPTNHLDLRYQVETLELMCDLADAGVAVGVVLHDLDHAAAVADEVVLMQHGSVVAAGDPATVLTAENLTAAYGVPIDAAFDADAGRVRISPRGRHQARRQRQLV